MKNLKKLALLLTTVMMFFTLTACSSQPSTPTVPNPDTNGTSNSSNSSAPKNEVELVNRDGVKITIVGGLDTTGSVFGPQLKLRVENSSGHNITVQSRKTSVNGYTMGDFGAIMSIDVTHGEKAYGTFTLYNSKLQDAGITTIQNIKTSFHVYDSDSWNTLFDTDLITITF